MTKNEKTTVGKAWTAIIAEYHKHCLICPLEPFIVLREYPFSKENPHFICQLCLDDVITRYRHLRERRYKEA